MAPEKPKSAIETLQVDVKKYPPPAAFAAQANAKPEIYDQELEAFWDKEAKSRISWFKPYHKVLEWNLPYAKWFVGGELNICYNCVDRHVEAGKGAKVAYYWEGEGVGERKTITYSDLLKDVVKLTNGLRKLGVKKGTHCGIYIAMVPELPVLMLALARIGAPFTVVFAGFSPDSLADRFNDMEVEFVFTQNEGLRGGKRLPLKANVDEALKQVPTVKKMVVYKRTDGATAMQVGRDLWWHDVTAGQSDDPKSCPCESLDSEHMLYLLYTSGTTAKPKGIMHTTGGYLVGTATTHHYIFDIKPEDVYWCAADIGWVTGQSYIVYGPLANGCTGVIYEGTPNFPNAERWWDIIERYKVSILYTAPTAIRAHMKWGPQHAAKHDLKSLRLLGSVGEPINPEAWEWYHEHIGGRRCPIVDTWWQPETGMILITPLPVITTLKPGSPTKPFTGLVVALVNDKGEEVPIGGGGYLVLKSPWPAMLRGIYKAPERYVQTYWSRFPGMYFAGDGARMDKDGDLWLMGRVDDVMNVSGHRISTIEVESALVDHPKVAEAAVCGRADALTGQAIVAFVTLKSGFEATPEMLAELREHVGKKIGALAKPANIVFTPDLPKTRSGKIMRRLLRDVAENRPLGDTTTLADAAVVKEIATRAVTEATQHEV